MDVARSEESCVRLSGHTHASDSRGDTVRRITKAALGGLAGGALILGGTQVAVGVIEMFPTDGGVAIDLDPTTTDAPFDGASVTLQVQKNGGDGTNFVLDVTGINQAAVGEEFGAHLHSKACHDTSGGPHYNHEVVAGGVPVEDAEISRRTEVWFDLVPNADGVARDSSTVKFVPVDPEVLDPLVGPGLVQPMSIVLHNDSTAPKTGKAGLREACFTLDAQWAETP
jgi:hypothetical protein